MNFIVIVADDLRNDLLGYLPHTCRHLKDQGKSFTACRLNVPLCQPARVGFFSGQYSKRTGVNANNTWPASFDANNTLAKWMDDAGFRTGMIGKYMNSVTTTTPKPTGWDTWGELTPNNGQAEYVTSVHNGSSSTAVTGRIADYLAAQANSFIASSEPFMLWLNPPNPHWPLSPPPGNVHAYSTEHEQWPLFEEADVSDKPSWVQSRPAMTETDRFDIRFTIREYLRELWELDQMINSILSNVDFSDTTVFFTSDNGVHWGEHRYFSDLGGPKFICYDVCLKVNLMVRGPDFLGGRVDDNPTSNVDIAATIAALASVTPQISVDGIDLRSTSSTRMLLHELGDPTGTQATGRPTAKGITTKTRKLFRYDGQSGTDKYECYDLDTDPNELSNWANDSGRLSERNSLEADLDALLA
jgi:arylsulfatase A-like enzyme